MSRQGEGCSHWNYASFARDGKNVPRNNPNKLIGSELIITH